MLPAAGFIQLRIDALVRVRCPVPVETRFSIRPFALRQRRSTLRQTSAAGSTFLACIFETIPKFSSARSVPNSRPRLAFYGHSRRVHRSKPVADSTFGTQRLSSGLRSPSGSLNPFGSMRPVRFQTLRLAFASRPIFLRSPPRLNNYLSLCASDHRSRSATSRQARFPSNLLEP